MRIRSGMIGLFVVVSLGAFTEAAPPKDKPAAKPPAVNGDALSAGQFTGTLVSLPNSDRMFTVTVAYPEVQLKPGAKMPNLQHNQAQALHRQYQQVINLQRQMGRSNVSHHAFHNMMQMQQVYVQIQMNQQRAMQQIARIKQQELQRELKLLQQEIRIIQNLYQVVQVKRDVDFQAAENVKVRVKDLPQQFDEKGNIKKYTKEELLELKGKDKNLIGYASGLDALKPGQTVLVALRVHKQTRSTASAPPAPKKEKEAEIKETDASLGHKMQTTLIVIMQDGDTAPSSSPTQSKKNKK